MSASRRRADLGRYFAPAVTRWVADCLAAACVCIRPSPDGSGGCRRVGWQPLGSVVLASCEASGVAAVRAEQFSVRVDDEVLDDLRARIRSTRWPGPAPGALWEQGTDLGYLRGLLGYWADGFDWRAQERWLNGFRHFRAGIDGVRVHFVHEPARGGRGIPLILTNGWPSCFAEFLPLVPWLTDPAAHGIDGPGLTW